jgi:hypothetical protein
MDQLDGFPKLVAYKLKDGTCAAWCVLCQAWHHHGCGGREWPGGHRSEHCATLVMNRKTKRYEDVVPAYKRTNGYVLVSFGMASDEIERDAHHTTQKPKGPPVEIQAQAALMA